MNLEPACAAALRVDRRVVEARLAVGDGHHCLAVPCVGRLADDCVHVGVGEEYNNRYMITETVVPIRVPVGSGFYVVLNLPTEISLRTDQETYWLSPDDIDDLTATRSAYRYMATSLPTEVSLIKAG